ncbi:MAG: hypothetical protein IJF37_09845 [Lachnospiraceae bacterium]|nr:hypothetical protein [Lachnospiraceae bacterium]
MIREILELVLNFVKSRVFILSLFFCGLFAILVVRVFNLQVVNSEDYAVGYTQMSEKIRYSTGTRGNIYDADGNILAYNEPIYSVTMEDTLDSGKTKSDSLNAIIYKTISIIEKYGDSIIMDFPLVMDASGVVSFSSEISESTRLRFLKDIYGTEKLDTEDKKLSEESAENVFQYLCGEEKYDVDNELYTREDAIKIVMVRYNLSLNAYQKYISTSIAEDVSEKTVAAIYENAADIPGVSISEDTKRVYNNAMYYSLIVGYTGKISEEQLTSLNDEIDDETDKYVLNDIVGKNGIEATMELTLSGNKGYEKVFVDNTGKVIDISESKAATAGEDVYLTIKSDYQIGIYHLLEQNLANILVKNIVNRDLTEADKEDNKIPIKDVYFQMINNNVVDVEHFDDEDATDNEKSIFQRMTTRKDEIIAEIKQQLYNDEAVPLSQLTDEKNAYYTYIFNMLSDTSYGNNVIPKTNFNSEDETYAEWMRDNLSLREMLLYSVSSNYVELSKLNLDKNYADSETVYNALVDYIIEKLTANDKNFTKLIYEYLINTGRIAGKEICLLLFDQNVLKFDANTYNRLERGSYSAYDFMIDQIKAINITPAQVALTPCSASVTLVDVDTGDVLAMVSYPSYDNNVFSGAIDYEYWTQLSEDLSSPLYSRATKMRLAPGSTFKPLTAIAGIEEGVITPTSTIQTEGIFTKVVPSPKCWIYPRRHGLINVTKAIEVSCNCFFYEVGYRLGCKHTGSYNDANGLSLLEKYGAMVGLTETSGVEVEEYAPHFSDTNIVASSIGQGSHSYTGVQLARYVNTIAGNGVNRELTLIKDIVDYEGNSLGAPEKEVSVMEVSEESIKTAKKGMENAANSYSALKSTGYKIAAKSGTAQENANMPDHATLIAYTPSDNPEVSMSIVVQNGYTSTYSIKIGSEVARFYYGEYTLEQILAGNYDGPYIEPAVSGEQPAQ